MGVAVSRLERSSQLKQGSPAGKPDACQAHAFAGSFRKPIDQLTRSAPPLADLARSFPALLFALATDYGAPSARQHTVRLVVEGAPLAEAARALGLPLWLRRLPPAAFREPLVDIPASETFATRARSLMPTGDLESRVWLWGLLYGARFCDETFALWAAGWLGRSAHIFSLPYGEDTFRYLTAWGWASRHSRGALHRLLPRTWSSGAGLRRALDDLGAWRLRIDLALCLAERAGAGWARPGSCDGYDFVALESAEDFLAEARVMSNCLDIYAAKLRLNRSSIYSMRRHQEHVAVVEIGPHPDDPRVPALLQLRGPRNRRLDPDVWQACYLWLATHQSPCERPRLTPTPSRGRATANALWHDYLDWQAARGGDARFRQLVLGLPRVSRTARRPGRRSQAVRARASKAAVGEQVSSGGSPAL